MRPAERPRLVQAPLHPDLEVSLLGALDAAAIQAAPLALLVPTRALGRALLRAYARRHRATFGVRPLTWVDLALLLTARERGGEYHLLSAEARGWLVRRLHRAPDREPTCFDPVLEVRGMRAALLRTFEELGRAGLATRGEVEQVLLEHGLELPLQARHALELYRAYRQSFEPGHDDYAALLARAAATPAGRAAAVLGGPRLWIYGFAELDGVERRLLAHLARDSSLELCAYVPQSRAEESSRVEWLADLGFEPRAAAAAASPQPEVRVLATPSEEGEADEIARQLLSAVDAGLRFSDMAVVVRSPRRLELLRSTFERRGIPFELHPPPSLQSCRAGRALLGFLDLLSTGLDPGPVLDFLGVAPLAAGEWAGLEGDPVASAWERVARETALGQGLEDWSVKLQRCRDEYAKQAETEERDGEPSVRARALAQAADELLRLAAALDRALGCFPERGPWRDLVAAADAFLRQALSPAPEVEALRATVQRLAALDALAPGEVSRGEFRDAVRAVLADARQPDPEPTRLEAVQVGTAAALHGIGFDLVCLAGVQEGEWPAAPAQDPVLLWRDRQALADRLGDRLLWVSPDAALARDRRLFESWCAAARRRLILSYARFDAANGASRLPSSFLLEFATQRQGRTIDYTEFESLPWVERVPLRRTALPAELPVLGLDEFDTATVLALPRAAAHRYVTGLGVHARRGLGLDRLRNQWRRFTSVDGVLSGRAALAALVEHLARPSFSATELVTYATCPFRYFMRHVLRVEPLERDAGRELSDLEFGRLVHAVLEGFHRQLAADGGTLDRIEDPELGSRLDAALQPLLAALETSGQARSTLLWQIRAQRLREDLWRYLRVERARGSGGWRPVEFELRFGRGSARAPVVRDARRAVALHGRIDRLDRNPRTGGVRVVDYKTGRVLGRHQEPQALQLAVYLFAATEGDPAALARSEACFVYVTSRGAFAIQRLPGSVLAARRADLDRLVFEIAAGIARGQFFPHPGDGARNCRVCDYQGLCETRVADQAANKSGDGRTAALLALPDFATALESVASVGSPAAGEAGEEA